MTAAVSAERRQQAPSFAQGALLAFAMALAGAMALVAVQAPVIIAEFGAVLSTLPFGLLTGVYLLYLRQRAVRPRGSLSLMCLWLFGALALLATAAPASLQLLWHLAAISGIRSLLFHERLIGWLADCALTLGAATAAGLALAHSHSPLLALWTFFLLQSFWPELQARLRRRDSQNDPGNDDFDRAHEHATRAVRRLTRTQLDC